LFIAEKGIAVADTGEAKQAGGHFALRFEAKGIQRYIFDGGTLRDLIGASELVATITSPDTRGKPINPESGEVAPGPERGTASGQADPLVDQAIKAVEAGGLTFSRKAGGVFLAHGDDRAKLADLRALMRLAVGQTRPGLELSDAIGQGKTTLEAGKDAYGTGSAVRENTVASLPPLAGPAAAFAPRTGRASAGVIRYFSAQDTFDDHPVDLVTRPIRLRADRLQGVMDDGVARRFLEPDTRLHFPRNFDDSQAKPPHDTGKGTPNPLFPFRGRDKRIAVVHADLSGLGAIYKAARDAMDKGGRSPEDAKEFSDTIEQAIETAARNATKEVLVPASADWPPVNPRLKLVPASADRPPANPTLKLVPARPVVLGGDDLTIIVRADLALPFAEVLLAEIEQRTGEALATLKGKRWPLGDATSLTACAGVAIAEAGRPMSMLNALAESLCKHAKKVAKEAAPYLSMLSFHVSTSGLREDYDEVERRELTHGAIRLTANPYRVGNGDRGQDFAALKALAAGLDRFPRGRGKLMEALGALRTNASVSRTHWERWLEVLRADNPGNPPGLPDLLAFEGRNFDEVAGLFSDALELIDIGTDLASSSAQSGAETAA
jgi:hypothetical protein